MLKKIYYVFALYLLSVGLVAASDVQKKGENSGKDSGVDKLKMQVSEFKIENKNIVSFLFELGHLGHVMVCIEDYSSGSKFYLDGKKISLDVKNKTIEDILNEAQKKSDVFNWSRDGDVVNIIAKPLVNKDNPFDKTIDKFKFKGTSADFLQKMNRIEPSLMASHLRISGTGDDPVEVFEVGIESRKTLRQAFNAFSVVSRMRWHAYVRDVPKPFKVPIKPPSGRAVYSEVADRTMIQFIKVGWKDAED